MRKNARIKARWSVFRLALIVALAMPSLAGFFATSHVAYAADSIAGQWEITWNLDAGNTTCENMAAERTITYIVSQSDDLEQVEFFRYGEDDLNIPAAAVSATSWQDEDTVVLEGGFYRTTETMELDTTGANAIGSGSLTIEDADANCTTAYTLNTATRSGDAPVSTVCASGCDYTTIQDAVDNEAIGNIVMVKVANGTYTSEEADQVVLTENNLILRGGYTTANFTIPNPETNVTTIDGEYERRAIEVRNDDAENPLNIIVMGFTITRGNATGLVGGTSRYGADGDYGMGGGFYAENANINLAHNTITNNYVLAPAALLGTNTAGYGGGLSITASSSIIRDNTISNNKSQDGGGLFVFQSTYTMLSDNTIDNNISYRAGPATDYTGSADGFDYTPDYTNDTQNTEFGYGGGATVVWNNGPVTAQYNTVTNNYSDLNGGGLLIPVNIGEEEATSAILVRRNLIAGNTAREIGGGGVIDSALPNTTLAVPPITVNSALNVADNIFVNNTARYGGGFAFERSRGIVSNNIAYNNATATQADPQELDPDVEEHASGFLFESFQGNVINNTIVGNTTGEGSGVYVTNWDLELSGGIPAPYPNTYINMVNNIIGGNGVGVTVTESDAVADEGETLAPATNIARLNNTLWGTEDWANTQDTATVDVADNTGAAVILNEDGNITGDPGFVNTTTYGDYPQAATDYFHIDSGSAAYDAGTNPNITPINVESDFDGDDRPLGDAYDIGADEITPPEASDIQGEWTFEWLVGSSTCSGVVPPGVGLTMPGITIAQSGDDIELLAPGYGNWLDIPGMADPLYVPGQVVDLIGTCSTETGECTAGSEYLRAEEELTLETSEDGDITGGTVRITYNGYPNVDGTGAVYDDECVIISDLQEATKTRDESEFVRTVCDDGCDYTDIQTAVDEADERFVIKIAGGTYTGAGTELVSVDTEIMLRGGYSTSNWAVPDTTNNETILDAEDTAGRRAIYIPGTGMNTTRVILTGLTLTGGNATGLGEMEGTAYFPDALVEGVGAGLYAENATVTIIKSLISGNNVAGDTTLGLGGGLGFYNSAVVVRDSTISDNTSQDGGGVYAACTSATSAIDTAERGSLVFSNNTIRDNVSQQVTAMNNFGYAGGANFVACPSVRFEDNTVAYNTSDLHGGGILIPALDTEALDARYMTVAMSGNTFDSNESAIFGGGGVVDRAATLEFSRNVVRSNQGRRGAGFTIANSVAEVVNNIIANNETVDVEGVDDATTPIEGSGLVIESSEATLLHNTIAGNYGVETGGASGVHLIRLDAGSNLYDNEGNVYSDVTMTNNIVVGHEVGVKIEEYDDDVNNGEVTLDYTFWGDDSWANDANTAGPDGTITTSNDVFGAPSFVDPFQDDGEGGFTGTGNYRLNSTSDAIDAGTDAGITEDIDRETRPVDDTYDIGADETAGTVDGPPNIEGVWDLVWDLDHDATTCDVPEEQDQVTKQAIISQRDNEYAIELFTVGYNNEAPVDAELNFPDDPVVQLKGQFNVPLDGSFMVETNYLRKYETIEASTSADGRIDSGQVIQRFANGCQLVANLSSATLVEGIETHTVCETGCDYSVIQDAVDAADAGDIVKVAAGTYSTINNQGALAQVVYIDKDITLRGGYSTSNWATPDPDANETIIDPDGDGRGIVVVGTEETIDTTRAVITGFTIQNGSSVIETEAGTEGLGGRELRPAYGMGGGAYAQFATVTFIDMTFTDNTSLSPEAGFELGQAGYGGALALSGCYAAVRNSTFTNNESQDGGAIFSYDGRGLLFSNNTFENNHSISSASDNSNVTSTDFGYGGAMTLFFAPGGVTFRDNIVANNVAELHGGGVLIPIVFAGHVYFSGNTVENNICEGTGGGGAIDNIGGGVTFEGNTVIGNQAGYGGAYALAQSEFEIYNNVIARNQVVMPTIEGEPPERASGLFIESSTANVYHNTFVGQSDANGGEGSGLYVGIFVEEHLAAFMDTPDPLYSTAAITNNIFADNTVGVYSEEGNQTFRDEVQDGSNVARLDTNMWGSGDMSNDANTGGTGTIDEANSLTGDPDFVAASSDDYHIGNDSDAHDAGLDLGVAYDIDNGVDAGDDGAVYTGDQRPLGSGYDIGADESAFVFVNTAPTVSGITKGGSAGETIAFAQSDFTNAFADDDDDTLDTVQITSLPDGATLTLDGTDVTAEQEIALANLGNLAFSAASAGTYTFGWNGSDGTAYADAAADVSVVVVAAENTALSVSDIEKDGTEDTEVSFTQTEFEAAFTGETLATVRITSLPDHGTLTRNDSAVAVNDEIAVGDLGNLTYMPDDDFYGDDSFGWNGSDGTNYAATGASVNIDIAAVNDAAPTVSNFQKIGYEGQILTFRQQDFTNSFNDADGDELYEIRIIGLPDNGVLQLNDADVAIDDTIAAANLGNLTYTPEGEYNAVDSFRWQGIDPAGTYSTNSALVEIAILPVDDEVTLTVSDIDKSGFEDGTVQFSRDDFTEAFSSNPEGEALDKILVASLPTSGTLTLGGENVVANQEISAGSLDNLTYTPNTGFVGTDSFLWNGSNDGIHYAASTAFVNLTIQEVGDEPEDPTDPDPEPTLTVSNITKEGNASGSVTFTANDFSEAFSGGTLQMVLITQMPRNGRLLLNLKSIKTNQEIPVADLDGLVFYPDGFSGIDGFNWNGSDGTQYATNNAEVILNIAADNQVPTVLNSAKTGYANETINFTVADFTTYFSDLDGDALVEIQLRSGVSNGTIQLNGADVALNTAIPVAQLGNLTYTPSSDGNDSFTWVGSDGLAYAENAASVNLTIVPVSNNLAVSTVVKEAEEGADVTFVASDFTDNFSGGTLEVIKIASRPVSGTLKLNNANVTVDKEIRVSDLRSGEAKLTYTPASSYVGTDSFLWNGSDGTSYAEERADVRIMFEPIKLPTVADFSVVGAEDNAIAIDLVNFVNHFTPAEGDGPLDDVLIVSLPSNGTLYLGKNEITSEDMRITVRQLETLGLSYESVGEGSVSFMWNGRSDGRHYAEADATVTLDVKNADTRPVLSSFSKQGRQGESIAFSLADFTDNFTDTGELEMVKIETLPVSGTLQVGTTDIITPDYEIAADLLSTLVYTPDAANVLYLGMDYFHWNGTDADGLYAKEPVTVTLDIMDMDEEVYIAENFAKEGTAGQSIAFSQNDFSDHFTPTGKLALVQVATLPTSGTLMIGETAIVTPGYELALADLDMLTYMPADGFSGTDSFTWNGSDGTISSIEAAIVTLNVAEAGPDTNVPTAIAPETGSIDENLPSGTMVMTLTTTDPDDPDGVGSYTYTLTSTDECAGSDNSHFIIDGDQVLISQTLDYDNPVDANGDNAYVICVQTADETGLTYMQQVTISVTDVPDVDIAPDTGGTLETTNDEGLTFHMHIPAGAVDQLTTIVYTKLATPTKGLTKHQSAKHAFTLIAYRNGVEVPDMLLTEAFTITLQYKDVPGEKERTIQLYYLDNGTWVEVGTITYDPDNDTVTIVISGGQVRLAAGQPLGEFALFYPEEAAPGGFSVYMPLVMR